MAKILEILKNQYLYLQGSLYINFLLCENYLEFCRNLDGKNAKYSSMNYDDYEERAMKQYGRDGEMAQKVIE